MLDHFLDVTKMVMINFINIKENKMIRILNEAD